jgi:glycosyltransferase involved in cell wall biosynthesis
MDRTIVVSEEMKEKGRLGKSAVIPCGVDLEQFKPMPKEEARKKLNLPQDKKLVLYAGEYFRPIKRFDIVWESMEVLRDRNPDVELVLVAKKPLNEVPIYMNACDVLVLVSDGEGSPQVIKEAMACNLPIVSVPAGDVPQVIGGTEGCYLCSQDPKEVADKLELALQRGKKTDGRERIKHLELGAISRRIITLYDSLLKEKKGHGLARLVFWRKDNKQGADGTAKKVCIVRQTHYPWQKNVRRNAETLFREGYEVDVICQRQKGQKKQETLNGVNVHRLPLTHHRGNTFWYLFDYLAFFVLASLKLAQLYLKNRYAAVEVNTMPDFLVFVAILPKLLGSKVILYMYENTPGLFISSFKISPNHVIARVLRFVEKVSAGYADRVIVSDGHPYKEILESRGIPSEKITVVLNVPDDTIFDPQSVSLSKDGNHFRLIVVSTLVKRYGIQTLIKAIPLIVDDVPNLVVDVVGDGEYKPDLERIASELKVEEYVNFMGHIRHDDVPSYIARALGDKRFTWSHSYVQ